MKEYRREICEELMSGGVETVQNILGREVSETELTEKAEDILTELDKALDFVSITKVAEEINACRQREEMQIENEER